MTLHHWKQQAPSKTNYRQSFSTTMNPRQYPEAWHSWKQASKLLKTPPNLPSSPAHHHPFQNQLFCQPWCISIRPTMQHSCQPHPSGINRTSQFWKQAYHTLLEWDKQDIDKPHPNIIPFGHTPFKYPTLALSSHETIPCIKHKVEWTLKWILD